ncbi:hypothetical protein IP81_09680 [Novosphingobium sp. AAP83]|uniref:hypothetical protein n=1 Tax=Novosphingobium sp. AAP83 TaxID=1523425 RepID=UPI0006B99068|nr:hypothetical protein [Novosphingobium sp. AAP83]KPF91756.1 hypothetical protein IP81_09680 [Novosphingobium sp. AAP83]
MSGTIVDQISRMFFMRGFASPDVALASSSLLVAWHEDRIEERVEPLFRRMADRLAARSDHDALSAAAEWFEDPGLSAAHWDVLAQGLQFLRSANHGPIDWTAELAACLTNDRQMQFGFNLSLPLARAITRIVDVPISDSCACLFPSSSTLAWVLSGDREVTLYAGDRDIGIIVALMARAACRTLKVDRRNPIDSTYQPMYSIADMPDRSPPFGRIDHIISMPPIGLRISDGPAKGMPVEAYQAERLAPHAAKSFSTIVTDGMLFRESKQEVDLRRGLTERYATTVLSLPSGMFWPASNVSTSMLRLEPSPASGIRVVDGRSMEKTSSGRAQENLIVRHLEQFQGVHPRDESRTEVISAGELALANYSLLPERYLRSDHLAQVESVLREQPQVCLSDIAEIERSKAPIPLRDPDEAPPITALEIAPSDIVDGLVCKPKRQQAFGIDQKASVERVTVAAGDILASIKGNVGIIGIVDVNGWLDAMLAEEPWIISQSLAIIRWKPNPHVPSAEILNALLTAPWVREKLESMSGGATVRTLPISALRSLMIPIPSAEDCEFAASELRLADEMRTDIERRINNLSQARRALWHKLWHLPPEIEEE